MVSPISPTNSATPAIDPSTSRSQQQTEPSPRSSRAIAQPNGLNSRRSLSSQTPQPPITAATEKPAWFDYLPPELIEKIIGQLDTDSTNFKALRASSKHLKSRADTQVNAIKIQLDRDTTTDLSRLANQTPQNFKPKQIKFLGDSQHLDLAQLAARYPNLTALDLSDVDNLTDANLIAIEQFSALKILALGRRYLYPLRLCITDASIQRLPRSLQSLQINNCTKISGAGLDRLTDLNHLEAKHCANLQNGSFAPELNYLNLSHCAHITGGTLGQLKKLTHLILWCCPAVNGTGLRGLPKQLMALDLEGCGQLTDDCLAQLKPLTALESLSLKNCNQISDAGLIHLNHAALKHLNLSACTNVTGLNLDRFKALESLCLNHCPNISEAAFAALPSRLKPQASVDTI